MPDIFFMYHFRSAMCNYNDTFIETVRENVANENAQELWAQAALLFVILYIKCTYKIIIKIVKLYVVSLKSSITEVIYLVAIKYNLQWILDDKI